uniref:Uncharacterized protein n=1 Tax=Anguilla anguilla TaxID=7936 RepID=A0A0E9VW33_ANGAN
MLYFCSILHMSLHKLVAKLH